MKRLLLIPLVLFSISYTQTVTYISYGDSTYYLVDSDDNIITILDYEIISQPLSNSTIQYTDVADILYAKDINEIKQIYNSKGDILYPDMGINTVSKVNISDSTKPQKTISRRGGYAGGVLIAIGAGMLYSNIGKECDDCDTQATIVFYKSLESTQKAGYVFIFLGGILVALGI